MLLLHLRRALTFGLPTLVVPHLGTHIEPTFVLRQEDTDPEGLGRQECVPRVCGGRPDPTQVWRDMAAVRRGRVLTVGAFGGYLYFIPTLVVLSTRTKYRYLTILVFVRE